ncbi:MAG: DinB family protein [Cytophagales bacterium]|nr:DinB family protein [Cytophagales bacterium]
MLSKSDIGQLPPFFERYIVQAGEGDIISELKASLNQLESLPLDRLNKLADRAYAPGKWTIKELLQHVIDNERIMAYRSLRFARNDKTILPGYDEDLFAAESFASQRNLSDIIQEFIHLKQSTIDLFSSFSPEVLLRKGTAFQTEISVLSLGFVIVGHQNHHFRVMEERYYPLA